MFDSKLEMASCYLHKYQIVELKENKALCDIAPTMLEILGLEQPEEMTGETILKK